MSHTVSKWSEVLECALFPTLLINLLQYWAHERCAVQALLCSDDRNKNKLENLHLQKKRLCNKSQHELECCFHFRPNIDFFKALQSVIHNAFKSTWLSSWKINIFYRLIDPGAVFGLLSPHPHEMPMHRYARTYFYLIFFVKGRIHTRFCACVDKSVIIILVPKILFELSWFNSCAVNRCFSCLEGSARLSFEGMEGQILL